MADSRFTFGGVGGDGGSVRVAGSGAASAAVVVAGTGERSGDLLARAFETRAVSQRLRLEAARIAGGAAPAARGGVESLAQAAAQPPRANASSISTLAGCWQPRSPRAGESRRPRLTPDRPADQRRARTAIAPDTKETDEGLAGSRTSRVSAGDCKPRDGAPGSPFRRSSDRRDVRRTAQLHCSMLRTPRCGSGWLGRLGVCISATTG